MLSEADQAAWRERMIGLGVPARKVDAFLGIQYADEVTRVDAGPGLDSEAPPPPAVKTLASGAVEAMAEMARYDAGDFSHRLQTGLRKLDARLRGGLQAGQLTVLGAPSGGGKTTLAQQIAAEAATKGPVLFVSPEMSCAELAEREIIRRSGRPLWDRNPWVFTGTAKGIAREAHEYAADKIIGDDLPFWVLDRDCTMAEIEAVAHGIKGLRLVVIDYAQQVASINPQTPRYLTVGDIAARAIVLAQALNIPILVASQVNVITEGKNKTYKFRESEVLEQKASVALILEVEWEEDAALRRRVKSAQLICKKQRHGQAFRCPVDFEPELYRSSDQADDKSSQTGSLELGW